MHYIWKRLQQVHAVCLELHKESTAGDKHTSFTLENQEEELKLNKSDNLLVDGDVVHICMSAIIKHFTALHCCLRAKDLLESTQSF